MNTTLDISAKTEGKVIEDVEAKAKEFYQTVGTKDDLHANPYSPWSKAEIERFFARLKGGR